MTNAPASGGSQLAEPGPCRLNSKASRFLLAHARALRVVMLSMNSLSANPQLSLLMHANVVLVSRLTDIAAPAFSPQGLFSMGSSVREEFKASILAIASPPRSLMPFVSRHKPASF